MHRMVAAGLAACFGLAVWNAPAQPPAPAAVQPDVLLRSVTAEVTAVLKRDAAAGQPTDVAQLVEKMILPLFDFPRMTRIAVARNWGQASPEQQAALVEQFTALLVRTYSTALATYSGQEIRYLPLRSAPVDSEVLVRSSVRRPGVEALTIDYDIRRASTADGLIKALADKNR